MKKPSTFSIMDKRVGSAMEKNGTWKNFIGYNISFFAPSKNFDKDNECSLFMLHIQE